jgi:hypothetical protein
MRRQKISENQVVIKLNEKSDGQWGTDHPEKWGEMTFEFVSEKIQIGQFQKIPQGFGGGSCEKAMLTGTGPIPLQMASGHF